jgi:hypothetical protein
VNAINIYESAAVSRLEENGIVYLSPSLWEMVKEYSREVLR